MADINPAVSWLRQRALEILQESHAQIKPSVLKLVVRRVGLQLLGNWLTCWDPVHMGGFRAALALEAATRKALGPLIDVACDQVFHGHVIPLQRVLALIDESSEAALGKCVCRASRITSDLTKDGRAYMVGDDAAVAGHLERILSVYDQLRAPGADPRTDPGILDALEVVRIAVDLEPRERLASLWRLTYPYWEILLTHDSFAPEWRQNMHAHHKSRPVDGALLKELVLAHFHVRGAIFTGMEVVGEKYCICTCPGPEVDGGCSLVNWHYFSGMDHAVFPNVDDFFGQRRGADGSVLPCGRFEARASRPCLGCGCEHPAP